MVLKQPAPEFSRPLDVARVPAHGSTERIAANAEECARLARRLDLPAIHELKAELFAKPWRGGGMKVTGEIIADLEEVSVISLEAFRHEVRLPVERYFLPGPPADDDSQADDIDAIVAGHIDLGEVVAETLALELDPYPRKPGETFAATDDAEAETESRAFSGLKTLNPQNNTRK
jgi:uncharacterized metal-binding protein YceD (DUF177 family)